MVNCGQSLAMLKLMLFMYFDFKITKFNKFIVFIKNNDIVIAIYIVINDKRAKILF